MGKQITYVILSENQQAIYKTKHGDESVIIKNIQRDKYNSI